MSANSGAKVYLKSKLLYSYNNLGIKKEKQIHVKLPIKNDLKIIYNTSLTNGNSNLFFKHQLPETEEKKKKDSLKATYLGCYNDKSNNRDLKKYYYLGSNATVENCVKTCKSRNFKFIF